MTSAPAAATPETAATDRPLTWGDHAVHFAGVIATYPDHDRGALADLRRMDPDSDDPAVLWRLLASRDLLDNSNREVERKWALILHGIALMTRTAAADLNSRSAHNRDVPVGRALYLGSESTRATAFYSETRFNRLLNAREDMLRVLLGRMFRMAAGGGVTFNWREMANFIRNADFGDSDEAAEFFRRRDEAAERSRRRMARHYYQTQHRASARSNNDDKG